MENNETFGQRFIRLRKTKNLTQAEVAEKLNVSGQAVSKWETDASMPDIALLAPISDLFGVSIDELFGKKTNNPEFTGKPLTNNQIQNLMVRIKITSGDGDDVKVNLPMGLVEVIAKSGSASFVKGNKSLEGIDFASIVDLAKQGVLGQLVEINSSDGDHVSIVIEPAK